MTTQTRSVDGTCASGFEPMRDLLAGSLASGADLGAAVAVVHDGELVVDLWGGEARPGVAWHRDTIVQVYSVTKIMCALAVLVLVDRGEIDPAATVASYWPAFGAAGKDAVTVRELMGHASRVPGWSTPITVEEMCDLEPSEGRLAAEEPWYSDGIAYQALNHGHLLDGVVRGATGRTVAEVLRTEVVAPAGGGFFLGVPDDRLDDCADLVIAGDLSGLGALPPESMLVRAMFNPVCTPEVCNTVPWRTAAVGGLGGHGTARAIALVQSALSHGGAVCGQQLIRPETVDRIWSETPLSGVDHVLMTQLSYSLGWSLPGPAAPAVPEGKACWWTGWGGAVVVNDAARRTTVCYTPNAIDPLHMTTSARTESYVRTALELVG